MCDSTTSPDNSSNEPNFSLTGNLSNSNNTLLNISIKTNGPVFSTDGSYSAGKENLIKTHFGIWIEDSQGNFIKTLKLNTSVPKVNKYGADKLESLPTWYEKSNVGNTISKDITTDSIYVEFDGLTSASLNCYGNTEDTVSAVWDFTDNDGKPVASGSYRYCAEISALLKLIDKEKSTADTTIYQESQYPSYTKSGTFEYSVQ